jgi:hypothetical protein
MSDADFIRTNAMKMLAHLLAVGCVIVAVM